MRKFAIAAFAAAMAVSVGSLASGSADASPRLTAQNLAHNAVNAQLTEEIRHRRRRHRGGVYLSLPLFGFGYGYHRPYYYERPYRHGRKHRRYRRHRNNQWQYNGNNWGRPGYGLRGSGR